MLMQLTTVDFVTDHSLKVFARDQIEATCVKSVFDSVENDMAIRQVARQ
jgi:hypothetical protein